VEALEKAVSIIRDIESELDSREIRETFLNRGNIVDLLKDADRYLEEKRGVPAE